MLYIVITGLFISKFWIGIYEDDEFFHKSIFIKHRPVWKTFFYSPRGMGDRELSDMTEEQQKEQKYFDEFILERMHL